jgi:hypothetical protein
MIEHAEAMKAAPPRGLLFVPSFFRAAEQANRPKPPRRPKTRAANNTRGAFSAPSFCINKRRLANTPRELYTFCEVIQWIKRRKKKTGEKNKQRNTCCVF